jgi:hypothetical protein
MALCTFYFCFPISTVLAKISSLLDFCHLRLCNCHTRLYNREDTVALSITLPKQQNGLKTQMVELLIGFVCFCGLSLLNAPWSTVPLLLPLFGSVPTDLA